MMDNYDAIHKKEEENYEFLCKYILYCKGFDPVFSREAKHMIVQYYASIMTSNDSQASPRLLETLNNLCRAVARLKQKDTIDVADAKEVMQFYKVQLVQHLSQVIDIPADPRDLAVEVITNVLKGSKFKHEFIELLKTACQRNQWISQYIGFNNEGRRDWSVGTNRRVRQVRDRFIEGANNDKIVKISISPLVLAWRTTYVGGDKDATTNSDGGNSGSGQESGTEQQHNVVYVSDTIDTIDKGKSGTVVNDAATDKIVSTDSNHINDETTTSIMSNMSITSTTEASHSSHEEKDLEGSVHDQQEKSAAPLDTQANPNENLVEPKGQSIKDQSGEEVTQPEDYQDYVARQEQIFNIYSEKDTTAISSKISDSDQEPKLPPYVSRIYPGSDLFKCEYYSIKQDKWGMADHFHSEESKKRRK